MTRVALVTGASSGIGRASALELASRGCHVVLVARRRETLAEVAAAVAERSGAGATVLPADLASPTERDGLCREVQGRFDRLDVLVNAAGVLQASGPDLGPLAGWSRQLELNATAPFHLLQALLPLLVAARGAVVNVSSVAGLRAFPGLMGYCVSKAALDQLTRCAALDLAERGVRVNAVNPGVVVTELHRAGGMADDAYAAFLERSRSTHPLGRVGSAEEVAATIAFLASEEAAWITGVTLSVDGGRQLTCAR